MVKRLSQELSRAQQRDPELVPSATTSKPLQPPAFLEVFCIPARRAAY